MRERLLQAKHWIKVSWDWLNKRGGLAIIISALAALFTYAQWHTAKTALGDARSSSVKQAKESKKALAAVERSANAAALLAGSNATIAETAQKQMQLSERENEATLAENRHSVFLELRLYVSAKTFDLIGQMQEGSSIQARVFIVNSGRTPAIITNRCLDQGIFDLATGVPDKAYCPASVKPNVPKEDESEFILSLGDQIPIESLAYPVTQDIYISAQSPLSPMALFFYGHVQYKDALGSNINH